MISTIKKLMHFCGFDICRFSPDISESAQFMRQLKSHGINLVLDVGANIGQFGRKNLRDAGYRGRIVSFEPLSTAWKGLSAEAAGDPLWSIAPRMAIGSESGEIDINVAQNSVSSSILDMLPDHRKFAPLSAYVAVESVPIRRLDEVVPQYLLPDSKIFLKIDTQGFEDFVLQGADGILDRIMGIQLELSLIPLYSGQRLYDEMILRLKNAGFDLWGISTAFVDVDSGRMLQVDATFFRATQGV
jgi:FkbM family methyltransferase